MQGLLVMALACHRSESGTAKPPPHPAWTGSDRLDFAGRTLDIGVVDPASAPAILVGTPNQTEGEGPEGGAYVVDASTPPGVLDRVAIGAVVSGDRMDENFGYSAALVGDVTGDGIGDVAVAGVNESYAGTGTLEDAVGFMHVFLGPLPDHDLAEDDVWAVLAPDAGTHTDPTVVTFCGDVNGDGADDLCVGTTAPYPMSDTSEAAIYFGPLTPGWAPYSSHSVALVGPVDEGAGLTLAGGSDLDGDGFADLVVGALYLHDRAGGAYLVAAPDVGTTATNALPAWTGEPDGGEAGLALSVGGDLDGDGAQDAFIGAPLLADRKGRGYLVTSWSEGSLVDAYARFDGASAGDWAGYDAAIGDLDGDGAADLAMGIPRDLYFSANQPGRVAIWLGPIAPGAHDEADAATVITGSHEPDAFGIALDAGDVDEDGVDDLVVGAPLDSRMVPSSGAVHLFLGATIVP